MIQILMHGNFFHLTFLEDTPTSCNQIYCILRYKIKHKTDSLRVCSSLQCYRSFIIPFISKLHRNFDSTLLEIILFQKHNPGYDISHLITTKIKRQHILSQIWNQDANTHLKRCAKFIRILKMVLVYLGDLQSTLFLVASYCHKRQLL